MYLSNTLCTHTFVCGSKIYTITRFQVDRDIHLHHFVLLPGWVLDCGR